MNNTIKKTILLMIVTVFAKSLGFLREIVLANCYGSSIYSDAYLTAMNIPIVIFSIVGMAISTMFIPFFCEIKKRGSDEENNFTNNVINLVLISCIVLSLIGLIFTEELVKIFAIGFNGEVLNITIYFTRFSMIGIVFTGLSYVLMGYLQANDEFTIPGLVGIPKNIIIIVSIILSYYNGVEILIVGTLLGMATDFLIQIPKATKIGFKYKYYLNIKKKDWSSAMAIFIPVLIGVGINQINGIIDKSLASTLPTGSISSLNYANRLNGFVISLFVVSIISILYPKLARLDINKNQEKEDFIKIIKKYINILILVIIPLTIFIIIFANLIVSVVFERGAFDTLATTRTVNVLIFYAIGLVAFGLRELINKVYFSMKDTKTPMLNGAISVSFNIILNLVFIRYMGIAGLALATTISSIISVTLLLMKLNKKIGIFVKFDLFKVLLKAILASISMGIISLIFYKFMIKFIMIKIILLVVTLLFSIITYFMVLKILKVEDLNYINKELVVKLNRKK